MAAKSCGVRSPPIFVRIGRCISVGRVLFFLSVLAIRLLVKTHVQVAVQLGKGVVGRVVEDLGAGGVVGVQGGGGHLGHITGINIHVEVVADDLLPLFYSFAY